MPCSPIATGNGPPSRRPAGRAQQPGPLPTANPPVSGTPSGNSIPPDFEGTPTKLGEYHGRTNVLVLHPYDRQKPSALVRTLDLPKDKPATLSVWTASHDKGDWELRATANGQSLGNTAPHRSRHR